MQLDYTSRSHQGCNGNRDVAHQWTRVNAPRHSGGSYDLRCYNCDEFIFGENLVVTMHGESGRYYYLREPDYYNQPAIHHEVVDNLTYQRGKMSRQMRRQAVA